MQELSAAEKAAIQGALNNPDFASALAKFCDNRQERYTVLCRNQENIIPDTLDADMRKRAAVTQYAAIAKAYIQFESEFRRAAIQAVEESPENE